MRICIDGRLARRVGGTGVSTYGAGLAATVAGLGHHVEWLLEGRTGGRASVWHRAARLGAWPVPLDSGAGGGGDRVAGDLFRAAQIRFDLRRSLLPVRDRADPPTLMHWTYPLPLRFDGVPNLYTIHDLIPLLHPSLTPVPQRRMERLLRRVMETAAHVVTVSEASRREIIDTLRLPPERVTNTYQAITDERPDAATIARALAAVGLEPGGYVLHAGSVEPRKNVRRLIAAHRASRSRRMLVIAGPDGWRAGGEMEEAGPEVLRLPWAPRALLVVLIAGARLAIVPSLAEGFGLVVAEAMTLGTPVLCSDRGALAEIAGGAARLVDPVDTAALAAAIAELEEDDDALDSLVAAGRQRATLFTPAAHGARLEPLYYR